MPMWIVKVITRILYFKFIPTRMTNVFCHLWLINSLRSTLMPIFSSLASTASEVYIRSR